MEILGNGRVGILEQGHWVCGEGDIAVHGCFYFVFVCDPFKGHTKECSNGKHNEYTNPILLGLLLCQGNPVQTVSVGIFLC